MLHTWLAPAMLDLSNVTRAEQAATPAGRLNSVATCWTLRHELVAVQVPPTLTCVILQVVLQLSGLVGLDGPLRRRSVMLQGV